MRKCYNEYCDKPAVGDVKYARCRRCFIEQIHTYLDRLCVCEYSDDCICRWDYDKKKEKRQLYLKHHKIARVCQGCGVAMRYYLLGVLLGGKMCYGENYVANLCYACNEVEDNATTKAWKKKRKKPPQISFEGVAYRIENVEGVGPFRSRPVFSLALAYERAVASMMAVPQDEGVYDSGVYAFTSMEALNYYILPKLLDDWKSQGYRVYECKVKKYKVFDNGLQVVIKDKKIVKQAVE